MILLIFILQSIVNKQVSIFWYVDGLLALPFMYVFELVELALLIFPLLKDSSY